MIPGAAAPLAVFRTLGSRDLGRTDPTPRFLHDFYLYPVEAFLGCLGIIYEEVIGRREPFWPFHLAKLPTRDLSLDRHL